MELVIILIVLGFTGVAVAKYIKGRNKKEVKTPKQPGPGVGVPGEKGLVNKE